MSPRSLTHRLRDDAGTALVEFAFVLPLLILLAIGIVDFGKAFNYWNDTNHLAATGARFAAVDRNPGAPESLQSFIAAQGDTAELREALSVCMSTPDGDVVGGRVEVVVTAPYQFLPYLTARLGISPVTLRGTAVMRLEQVPGTNEDGFVPDAACP